jgi:ankyrin repeat protein
MSQQPADDQMYRAPQGGQAELLDEAARKEQEGQLREAAREGRLATVLSLLAAKAPVDAMDVEKSTPMIQAIENGRQAVVDMLLKAKADPIAQDRGGYTLLHRAVGVHGQGPEIVGALLAAKADVNAAGHYIPSPLWSAITWGCAGVVACLLTAKADLGVVNEHGLSPLYEAAAGGHASMVCQLLHAKADANVVGPVGDTPLHAAAGCDHVAVGTRNSIVHNLLVAKANVNSVCVDGKTTPLSQAVYYRHTFVARRLLAAKAGATVVDRDDLRATLVAQSRR